MAGTNNHPVPTARHDRAGFFAPSRFSCLPKSSNASPHAAVLQLAAEPGMHPTCWPCAACAATAMHTHGSPCSRPPSTGSKPLTRGPDLQHDVLAKGIAGGADGGACCLVLLILQQTKVGAARVMRGDRSQGAIALDQVCRAGRAPDTSHPCRRLAPQARAEQPCAQAHMAGPAMAKQRPPCPDDSPAAAAHREVGRGAGARLHHHVLEAGLLEGGHAGGGERHAALVGVRLAGHACAGEQGMQGVGVRAGCARRRQCHHSTVDRGGAATQALAPRPARHGFGGAPMVRSA